MKVFDLLAIMNPAVRAAETKIHLATWNGVENPLDLYLAGKFDEWQRWWTRPSENVPFGHRKMYHPEALFLLAQ
jgi:hypothetical protein